MQRRVTHVLFHAEAPARTGLNVLRVFHDTVLSGTLRFVHCHVRLADQVVHFLSAVRVSDHAHTHRTIIVTVF